MTIYKLEQKSKQDIMNYIQNAMSKINMEINPKFALVVEGESFFKIQQSKRLVENFVKLALNSTVVIACRLSPK